MVTARARNERACRLWRASVGPRPAGARVSGAICGVAAPAGSLSHRSLFGLWRNLGCRRSKEHSARALVCSQIWDVALAPQTDRKANRKMAPPQNEAVGNTGARAILTRAVNLCGFPPGERGWGRIIRLANGAKVGTLLCFSSGLHLAPHQLSVRG